MLAKGHRPVVGEALGDKHMAVETPQLVDRHNTYATKGIGCRGENLPLGDIGLEGGVRIAVEPEEGERPGDDVPLQGTLGIIRGSTFLTREIFKIFQEFTCLGPEEYKLL